MFDISCLRNLKGGTSLSLSFAFAVLSGSFAFAQETGVAAPALEQEPSLGAVFMQMLPVYVLVIAVYYLLVLKPQQKKQAAQLQFKSSMKKGDSVLTSSGIVGKVVGIEEDFVSLEIAPNVKIKIAASHVVAKPEDLVNTGSLAKTNSGTESGKPKAASNS